MYHILSYASMNAPLTNLLGDVGGQKTLRTYWKNYFEKTDTLIWVVDSTDRERVGDCRAELESLLLEEVRAHVAAGLRVHADGKRVHAASLWS